MKNTSASNLVSFNNASKDSTLKNNLSLVTGLFEFYKIIRGVSVQTKLIFIIYIIFFFYSFSTKAQDTTVIRRCYADDNHENQHSRISIEEDNHNFVERQNRVAKVNAPGPNNGVLTIPVVFHVLYNTAAENIPLAKITEQLAILNEDYRMKNAGISTINAFHKGSEADAQIEFVLATLDPLCQTTTGIERRQIPHSYVDHQINEAKFFSLGGLDAWPSDQYLNIWVVPRIDLGTNTNTGIAGVGQFPGGDPKTDGVIITAPNVGFGSIPNYNLGRTATHEIGHWLGLRHLWGMNVDGCNAGDDDLVADTPMQTGPTTGCPGVGVKSTCSNWDMYENYMDYSFDQCMKFFTKGQVARMWATLANERKSFYEIATGKRTVTITSADVGYIGDNITLKYVMSPSCGANPVVSITNGTGTAVLNGNVITLTGVGTVTVKIDIPAGGGFTGASTTQVITILKYTPGEACPANFNLENGTKSNWVCKSGGFKDGAWSLPWLDCRNPRGINAPLMPAGAFYLEDLHVITSGFGTDPNSNGIVPVVCPTGGKYSVRIGDAKGFSAEDRVGGVQSNPSLFGWKHATAINYPLTVSKDNAKFVYMYAAFVQEDGSGGSSHVGTNAAGFQVLIYDSKGKEVACGKYDFDAHTHVGMTKGKDDSNGPWWFTNWTDVSIDLSAYLGQTINIEFRVQDCAFGAHSAYAYIDVKCEKPDFSTDKPICGNVGEVELCAPTGYQTYKWGPNSKITSALDKTCVKVNNPQVGDIYSVAVTTFTGCPITLTKTIEGFAVNITPIPTICASETPNFTLFANPNDPAITYTWTSIPAGFSKVGNPLVVPTPDVTTVYKLQATNAAGCDGTSEVTVNIKACGITAKLDIAKEICKGDFADLTASCTGGTSPYTYKWLTAVPIVGNATQKVFPLITTTYKVEVTDASGFKDTAEVIIKVNQLPVINIDDKAICINDKTTFTATGGIDYVWSPATNLSATTGASVDANPTVNTKYMVIGTDAKGCKSSDSATVTVNPLPIVDAGNKFTICKGSTGQLNATGASAYVWAGANLSSLIVANPISSSTSKTLYSVIGTDAKGCKNTDTVTLDVQDKIVMSITPDKASICKGDNVKVVVTGGDTFTWTPTTAIDNTTINSPTLSPQVTTTYTVEGKQGTCPPATASIEITVQETIAPIVSDVNYCRDNIATALTATGTNLKWYIVTSGGVALASSPIPLTSSIGTTSYYVSQTVNNCEGPRVEQKVNVSITPPPTTTDIDYCKNTTATNLIANGLNIKWYTSLNGGVGVSILTPSTANIGMASYFASQTINGCESDRTVLKVTIKETLVPIVNNAVYCKDAIPNPWAVIGNNIKWYDAQLAGNEITPTPIISTTAAQNVDYFVSQTDNGCESNRVKINLLVNEIGSPKVADVNYCKGNTSAILNAIGSNLKWYSNQIGGVALSSAPSPLTTVVGTTSYFVTQTLNNCESQRAEIKVNVSETALPTGNEVVYCFGDVANALTANGQGLRWYPSLISQNSIAAPMPLTSKPGVVTYYVSQTVNGCEGDRLAINVTVNKTAVPAVEEVINYCRNSVAVPLNVTSGSGIIKWYNTNTASAALTLPYTPITTNIGQQEFWASQTINGCESDRVKQKVMVIDIPTLQSVVPDVICEGESLVVTLSLTGLAPFTIDYLYNNEPKTISSESGIVTLYYTPSESGKLFFTSIKDKVCAQAYSDLINTYLVNKLPKVNIVHPDTVCSKIGFDMNVSSPSDQNKLTWNTKYNPYNIGNSSGLDTNKSTYLINQLVENKSGSVQKAIYTFQASKDNCIGESKTIVVNVLPYYATTLPANIGPVCVGDSVMITAERAVVGTKLNWFSDGIAISNQTNKFHFKSKGEKSIKLQTQDYCKVEKEHLVNIDYLAKEALSLLQLDSCSNFYTPMSASTPSNIEKLKWLFGTSSDSSKYDNGKHNFSVKFPLPGQFLISIKGYDDQCMLIDTSIMIKAKDCSIITKNVFTPNGDGANDVWKIDGIENFSEASLVIFNRWGVKVKSVANHIDPSNAWDGTNEDGQLVESGTYYFILQLRDSLTPQKGYVSIITEK